MNMRAKSQVSVEFIIILSVLFIILLVILGTVYKRNTLLNSRNTEMFAKQVALQFSSELNAVFLVGDGFNKSINLPPTLRDGTGYNISVFGTDHVVDIVWTKLKTRSYSVPIIPGNINGTTTNLNGQINVTNRLGVIQIN
jgi:hypothetical protein